jgi:hypothetical protein
LETIEKYLHNLYRVRPDFVYSVSRDFAKSCQTSMLVLPDDVDAHPLLASIAIASLCPNAEITVFPWKEPPVLKARTINRARTFLKRHQTAQRKVSSRVSTRDRALRGCIGLQIAERNKKALYRRSDERAHTLCYSEGNPSDQAVGFEVKDEASLQHAASTMESLGHAFHAGTALPPRRGAHFQVAPPLRSPGAGFLFERSSRAGRERLESSKFFHVMTLPLGIS